MKITSHLFSSHLGLMAAICAFFGAGTALLAQAPAAPGAAPAATPAEKPKPLQSGDQTYLRNAGKSLNFQIQLAAAAKSITDPNLSRLRDSATTDLTTALTEVKKIADAHGEKLTLEPVGTEKYDLDRLAKVKPDKFPKEWVAALFKESKRLDHETEMAAKTAQDPQLKAFLGNYSPMIRNVFTSAEAADKALKGPQKK